MVVGQKRRAANTAEDELVEKRAAHQRERYLAALNQKVVEQELAALTHNRQETTSEYPHGSHQKNGIPLDIESTDGEWQN